MRGVQAVIPSLSDNGSAATLTVTGSGYTLLGGQNSFSTGTKFQVNGGNLVVLGQDSTNGPLGSQPIEA